MAGPSHAVLAVRVTPRASREAIGGWREGRLRISTTAPPVEGAANAAVCRLVASTLHVPVSAVQVVRGHKGRDKLVWITGLTNEDVLRRLGGSGGAGRDRDG